MKTHCPVCDEKTETEYRQVENNYIIHICCGCGADKRQDGKAPV